MSKRRSIKSVLTWISVFALTAFGLAACERKAETGREHSTTADAGYGLHTVNNIRLRTLMDELNTLDFDKISKDLAEGRDAGGVDEVANYAVALAADARMIPQAYKNIELTDAGRRDFEKLAVTLQEQSLELSEFARTRQTAGMQAKIKDIISTCNGCHAIFRGPTMAGLTLPRLQSEHVRYINLADRGWDYGAKRGASWRG